MKSNSGFTVIELIVVIAISSLLLIFTAVGINAIRLSQGRDILSQNILSRIRDARNLALNARVTTYKDPWVWGYVFVIGQDSTGTPTGEYCTYKWIDKNYNPTEVTTSFNGNLSYNIESVANFSSSLTGLECSITKEGFLKATSSTYKNDQIQVSLLPNNIHIPKYVVFESLTGKSFVFGGGANPPEITGISKIGFNVKGETNPADVKYINIFDKSDTAPFIPTI